MDIEKSMSKICSDLNIKFNKHAIQDWGIIHSDTKRVEEFINYFNSNDLNDYEQYYVFELIVASYNDAILEGIISEELAGKFSAIVRKSGENVKLNLVKDYWRKISENSEFPVGKLL